MSIDWTPLFGSEAGHVARHLEDAVAQEAAGRIGGAVLADRDAHRVDLEVVERDAGELQVVRLRPGRDEAACVGGGGVGQADAQRRTGLAATGHGRARDQWAEPASRQTHFQHRIA